MNDLIHLANLSNVPPDFLLWTVLIGLAALGTVVGVVSIWSMLRSRPPHEAPTRREFDTLSTRVQHIELSIPQMERRILDAVEKSTERLSDKIETVAERDSEARIEIFQRLNASDKQISRIEARSEI